jgi:NAD(P)H-dependent flavin oxidoreductase YrpB (nitropropane dioxygenase family)
VSQGIEASGHVRSTISLHVLLAEVFDAADVQVLAAGGIDQGRR